jgi:hypothetical protein
MAGRFPPEPLKTVVEEVASLLKARKETVSVVETAAGGLISAALLATPGASTFYKGGLTVCDASSVLFVLPVGFPNHKHTVWSPCHKQKLQW